MTRNGKIARLPDDIREELNRRLERNVQGITLVEWLNSLPQVSLFGLIRIHTGLFGQGHPGGKNAVEERGSEDASH